MAKKRRIAKADNEVVTRQLLEERSQAARRIGKPPAKWIWFCQRMLDLNYGVRLYEARKTNSKYITVTRGGENYKVRISDHKPIKGREANGDCDFFVGRTHFGITTTEQAVRAVNEHFGAAGLKDYYFL